LQLLASSNPNSFEESPFSFKITNIIKKMGGWSHLLMSCMAFKERPPLSQYQGKCCPLSNATFGHHYVVS
jgi:hypothetical protein